MSKLISLPQNLKIGYLYQDKPLDLSNWTPLAISLNGQGELTVESKDGVIKPKSLQELADFLSKYSVCFTYSPPGQDDSILTLLNNEELVELNVLGKASVGHVEVKRPRNSIKIGNTPIYNLINQTKTYRGMSLETCNQVATEVILSREPFGLFNVSSGAAEARALMSQSEEIQDELLLARSLKLDNIDKFNSACYGGRMESSGIGSQYQFHFDLIKAHLNILKQYPGIRDTTWSRGLTRQRYYDRALPHSIYCIKAYVPKNKFKFNPLPVKTEAGTKFPSGTIVGWYFKDYVDLLLELGVQFTILDSVQFNGEGSFPFRNHCSFISGVIKYFNAYHPDLESKHLYSTIAGSCKSIYKALEKDLSQSYTTSRVFDPVVYGFVLARQNVLLYDDAIQTNADAIKIDALAVSRKCNLGEQYRFSGEGVSTYLTPSLKSVPGGKSLYKEAIKKCRNIDRVTIEMNVWNSLPNYLSDSLTGNVSETSLGAKFRKTITIKPHYGSRKGRTIKRVGELLDHWLLSSPGDGINERDISLLKLEDYLDRFADK